MTEGLFHKRSDAGGSQFIATDTNGGRDGRNKLRPSRLVHAARRGVTLVELLISMLILTIVCLAWLEIIGIQSARKEARRREAVERLSGMMDAFMYEKKGTQVIRLATGDYRMSMSGSTLNFTTSGTGYVYPIFDGNESPVGYQLSVVKVPEDWTAYSSSGWGSSCRWLVGRLYDYNGKKDEVGKPFFSLPVCLGF